MLLDNYKGIIIEESLEDKSTLDDVKILKTDVEEVRESHKTPWLDKWTLHNVEVDGEKVGWIAEKISKALDSKHDWYADFKNDELHFIIFKNKVFKIGRGSEEQYGEATKYGLSLGIPEHQVDFSHFVKRGEK